MTKYEKYKPSGIDWIGEVPLDWEVKKLKHILLGVNSGEGISNNEMEEDGEFEIYGGNGVMGYTNKYNSGGKVIVIGRVGAKCGVTYLLDKNVWISDNALQARTYQDYKYLYYLLDAIDFNQYANQNAQPLITGTIVKNFPIPYIKNKEEQLTIANYLDQQTQKIDRLIANKKLQADKLKELRQVEINNAVTKGLNPDAELKDSGIDWMGKIPKHWELKRLKNVANYIQTGITPPSEKSEYYDGEIPWYGPGGFNGETILNNPAKFITQKAIDDNEAKLFPIDCIFMIGIGATIGKVGIIKEASSCNQQLNIINFKNKVNADFGVYFLKIYESVIINIANFSTLPIYNQVQTGNLKFLLPPVKEQIEIAKYLQQKTAAIDKLINSIKTQVEKYKIQVHKNQIGTRDITTITFDINQTPILKSILDNHIYPIISDSLL